MTAISDLVRKMADAGASAELIAIAVEAVEAAKAEPRAKSSGAARQAAYRARKASLNVTRDVTRDGVVTGVTESDVTGPSQVLPPRDINSTPISSPSESPLIASQSAPPPGAGRVRGVKSDEDFEAFYRAYPKHVDPQAARKKFDVVVRSGVDAGRIAAAAERFAEAHRRAGTDKQFIPAPAVWLNRGGYDSEDLPRAGPVRVTPGNRPQAGLSYGQMLAKVKGYPIDDGGNFDQGLARRRGSDEPAVVSLPLSAAFREPRD